eukprot:3296666-Amphidinium_carterae.1
MCPHGREDHCAVAPPDFIYLAQSVPSPHNCLQNAPSLSLSASLSAYHSELQKLRKTARLAHITLPNHPVLIQTSEDRFSFCPYHKNPRMLHDNNAKNRRCNPTKDIRNNAAQPY